MMVHFEPLVEEANAQHGLRNMTRTTFERTARVSPPWRLQMSWLMPHCLHTLHTTHHNTPTRTLHTQSMPARVAKEIILAA